MTEDRNLTQKQQKAAMHIGTHARLLAGPGTGKTFTLTKRVVYLVRKHHIIPEKIVVLTFTRAATGELRRRIVNELGEDGNKVHISTLHSYALKLILQHGASTKLPFPIRIADDWEERHIIEEDLKSILGLHSVKDVRRLLAQLSADWERSTANEVNYRFPNSGFLGTWQEHRYIFGYSLRAELVYQLKHALEEGAVQIKDPPQHLLVDEYQDLNPCDLAVVRKLSELGAELYVAGDDDQSIYGFRYGDPNGIRRFDQEYIPCTPLVLEECHRCGSLILDFASFVAAQDPRRIAKKVTSTAGVQSEVHILNFQNQNWEAEGVTYICKWLNSQKGIKPEQILILVRSDRKGVFSKPIREALQRQGLPVGSVADPLAPLNTSEGRQFLSLLRLIVNENDHFAWRTLLQLRKNRVGREMLKQLYDLARKRGNGFTDAIIVAANDVTLLANRYAQTFQYAVQKVRQIINSIRITLESNNNLVDVIRDLANNYIPDPNLRQEVVFLFERVINTVAPNDLKELLRALNISLNDVEQERQSGTINIMTMHQAKGLTAEAVFIVAAEDEYIPGRNQGDKLDDERRLLYVSLTRARRYLYVTYCLQRTGRQIHTGRNPGRLRRTLTRFISGGPIQPQKGGEYINRLV